MKKTIFFLMLVISIQASVCAQVTHRISNANKTFDFPPDKIDRQFLIDLGKGNKMQVELDNWADLDHFLNIDSMLRVFLHDIEPLKDSLSNELAVKRIDYVSDSSERKKIRIQQHIPIASSYLIEKGDLAALKLEQDTVTFMGSSSFMLHYLLEKWQKKDRPYRLSLFVNNLSDLPGLVGKLNEKILSLKQNVDSRLVADKDGVIHLKKDYQVTVKQPQGHVNGTGDYLTLQNSVALQNYKSYFVPSFSLGFSLFINGANNKLQFGAAWEPNFFFQNNLGKLQTFRNDFVTLLFSTSSITNNGNQKAGFRAALFSFSYLVHHEGGYFDKKAFRLGVGQVSLFHGLTTVEPVMYFTNFFRGVTPGLRLIQQF
ncbi:MAG TPA: hypothetical protein VK563_14730 [Puia sp.]|nr:hypothetical protein [Puia sp.]